MKIIGLGGTNGSGKDTVAELIHQIADCFVGSASAMLETELKKTGKNTGRVQKRELSAEWRRQYGLGAIVDKAIEQAKEAGKDKLVVGSLRNPGEVDRVHELGGIVLWIDADPRIRYERIQGADRGREAEDNKTYEEFLAEEQAEMNQSGDETTLSMAAVKEKSDIFIENDEDMKALESKLTRLIEDNFL